MADHLVDTHVLCWYLTADARLNANALAVMRAAEQGNRGQE